MTLSNTLRVPATAGRGLLPILRALIDDQKRVDVRSLPPSDVERAVARGFGPILARVSRDPVGADGGEPASAIYAADLTARLLTALRFDVVERILAAAAEARSEVVLLKGCATAIRYYPEPHLRTMGDVDLLAATNQVSIVESALRSVGFRETDETPPASHYEGHHHGMPLRHDEAGVWIELHTNLYSPRSPISRSAELSLGSIEPFLIEVPVGRSRARMLSHEAQLVYTSTRWAEYPSPERGAFPLLDAALLITRHGRELDWDLVCRLAGRSWGASALRIVLAFLERSGLAAVPPEVMKRLAAADPFTSGAIIAALHQFVMSFVIEGARPGRFLTRRNIRTIWTTLSAPDRPMRKWWLLPVNLILPRTERGRFDGALAAQRLRSVVNGVTRH